MLPSGNLLIFPCKHDDEVQNTIPNYAKSILWLSALDFFFFLIFNICFWLGFLYYNKSVLNFLLMPWSSSWNLRRCFWFNKLIHDTLHHFYLCLFEAHLLTISVSLLHVRRIVYSWWTWQVTDALLETYPLEYGENTIVFFIRSLLLMMDVALVFVIWIYVRIIYTYNIFICSAVIKGWLLVLFALPWPVACCKTLKLFWMCTLMCLECVCIWYPIVYINIATLIFLSFVLTD